jgi:hypothetical protein
MSSRSSASSGDEFIPLVQNGNVVIEPIAKMIEDIMLMKESKTRKPTRSPFGEKVSLGGILLSSGLGVIEQLKKSSARDQIDGGILL